MIVFNFDKILHKMTKQLIGTVLFLVIFTLSFSQRAKFEKQEITVGDQINLHLEISADAGKTIKFPEFDKELVTGIEVLKVSDIRKDRAGKYLVRDITVTSFKDSLFLIKGLKFIVDTDTLRSNPLRLKVSYFKPDSGFISKIDTSQIFKIADIKAPIKTPMTFKEFFMRFGLYVLIGIGLILLFFLIRFFIKKKREGELPVFIKTEPKIPPHVKAFERIENLKKNELHKKENLKPFYSELSDIIRLYIEERFQIPALESVTSEIIENFNTTEFAEKGTKNKLRELLSLSDTVKFAKNKPADHENEIMIEYALSFVSDTKEPEEKIENQGNR